MNEILVIPDIHGRSFWKKAKEFKGNIIFLGDLHDPYLNEYPKEFLSQEGIEKIYDDSLKNLKEIIEFAKENPKVTLLIGNHDYHYMHNGFDASRKDRRNWNEIHNLYTNNLNLFKFYKVIGNTLFTHAGVSTTWKEDWQVDPDESITTTIDNALLSEGIWRVSPFRGGYHRFASPLWLDVREICSNPLAIDNKVNFQIFGHTRQINPGGIIFVDNGASIDSRQIFIVDPENPFETLKLWQN